MADPRLMSMQQRYEAWADHALAVLIETAAVHQTAITYADLAARVQERSGITTTVPARSWLGKVLTIVGRRTREGGEPDLTSLVVQAGGGVGPGWDAIRSACGETPYGEAAREQAAAAARLECNRRFAPNVPEDAQPLLRPITDLDTLHAPKAKAPRAPRPAKVAAPRPTRPRPGDHAVVPEQQARFCPRCFMQLPLTGVCATCD